MTEEQARTKWCPFARYKSINGEGINRWATDEVQLNPEPARCIASDCMAWWWIIAPSRNIKGTGCCGLARTP